MNRTLEVALAAGVGGATGAVVGLLLEGGWLGLLIGVPTGALVTAFSTQPREAFGLTAKALREILSFLANLARQADKLPSRSTETANQLVSQYKARLFDAAWYCGFIAVILSAFLLPPWVVSQILSHQQIHQSAPDVWLVSFGAVGVCLVSLLMLDVISEFFRESHYSVSYKIRKAVKRRVDLFFEEELTQPQVVLTLILLYLWPVWWAPLELLAGVWALALAFDVARVISTLLINLILLLSSTQRLAAVQGACWGSILGMLLSQEVIPGGLIGLLTGSLVGTAIYQVKLLMERKYHHRYLPL